MAAAQVDALLACLSGHLHLVDADGARVADKVTAHLWLRSEGRDASWRVVTVPVAGRGLVEFKVADSGPAWAAYGDVGPAWVGVSGYGMQLGDLELRMSDEWHEVWEFSGFDLNKFKPPKK